MQKVFKFCYDLDYKCYKEYGLTEEILMENAVTGMVNDIRAILPTDIIEQISLLKVNN